jgi:hypothetical protein
LQSEPFWTIALWRWSVVKEIESWYNCCDHGIVLQEESPVIQRATQTASYWLEEFDLSQRDLGFVYDRILDEGRPLTTAALAQAVMERQCLEEEESIRAELGKGLLYRPEETYDVGSTLVFPALEYGAGTVVGTRPGRNPDHGDFMVIQVKLEGRERVREFASQLKGEHLLNQVEALESLVAAEGQRSAAELYEAYGLLVEELVVAALSERDQFVRFGSEWALRDMLIPMTAGHLNIAEALIEVRGMPLSTTELLPEMDLPAEVPEEVKILSVNHALETDARFDNVGDSGRDIWYLRRLTPEPVVNLPARLSVKLPPYDRRDIPEDLLAIEREIDDEASGEQVLGPTRPIYGTTIALTYPHWRIGSLPLTTRTRGLFPQATTHHTPVILVDGQTGDKMQGWVVHEESFVYGLKEWYKRNDLPVGVYLKLERTRDPRVITVAYELQRLKRLWIVVATAQQGRLTFQMRKLAIACRYDEQLAIGEDNPAALDRAWQEARDRGDSLLQTMTRIIPALIKLSPQGTVHAKTVYSAVNVLQRVPPGPVFALLAREPCFVSMGGGYWTIDEALLESGE